MQAAATSVKTPVSRPTYGVSDAAIENMREKSPGSTKDLRDTAVARLISDVVDQAPEGLVEIHDNTTGQVGWIATAKFEFWTGVAVLRRGRVGETRSTLIGLTEKVIVIVLSTRSARESLESTGRWEAAHGRPSTLAELLPSARSAHAPAAAPVGPLTQKLPLPVMHLVRRVEPAPAEPQSTDAIVVDDRTRSALRRGGTTAERRDYARGVLRLNPEMTLRGPGSLQEAMVARYGTGFRHEIAVQLREEIAWEAKLKARRDRRAAKQPRQAAMPENFGAPSGEPLLDTWRSTYDVEPMPPRHLDATPASPQDLAADLSAALAELQEARVILETAQRVHAAAWVSVAAIAGRLQGQILELANAREPGGLVAG